jgi:type I restriction enzyme S subunit
MELVAEKYKQTEVGLIPSDWEVKKLNEITNITRLAGYEYSTVWEETENGEITALRGFNIGKNKIIERDFVQISNKLSMRLIRSRLFKGDIVYPCVGSIGNAVVIEEDDKYHIQQNIAKITPIKNGVNSYFLSHYLMCDYGLKEIEKFNGSSSQPNILVGSLRKYSIILPTKAEQTLIATALSDADALISSLEKLIAKKRNIKQGSMQKLLQPKEGWEVKKLGEIAEIVGGGTPSSFIPSYWNGTINWFTPTEIGESKYTYESVRKITKEGFINCSGKMLPIGTILLTTRAGIGDLSILMSEGCTNQGFQSLIAKDGYYNEYLYYLMQTLKNILIQNASGSTFLEISPNKIKQIEIVVPSFSEQTRIATILSDMDAEISALETKLEKYKRVKLGMMQNLLTGKIRLV